ncbi:hypothetical protein [Photobacterium damselae]|uniref:hypothetical protein n=1 Tax=Photobacterium damselae TaxID=38293 RepID=UPI0010FE11DB|nr:hypothetical protein [Photobacterium damselae]TLS65121.1 hypothetical protein FD718_21105 [Photobacterium damselae subsp. damselae]
MTSKYAMNKTEAANYWKKSPNTIKKVIEENDIKPCGKDKRGNDVFECKDLAPYLVEQKKASRRRNRTLSDSKVEEIEELLQAFGSMKEFKEYEMALGQQQKRELEQRQLVKAVEAVAMFSGMFAILKKKFRQIPTEAERICPDWSGKHSERLDNKLVNMLKEVIRSAQEYADELQEHQSSD